MAIKYRLTGEEVKQRLINAAETLALQIEDLTYTDPHLTIQLTAGLGENISEDIVNYKAFNVVWNQDLINNQE